MALSGVEGYVEADGARKSADKWEAALEQAAVNRANFTTLGEPSNAGGQRTGVVSLEGPQEDGTVALTRGTVYTFKLGLTAEVWLSVPARVTNYTASNDANDGPRFKVTAQQHGSVTFHFAE